MLSEKLGEGDAGRSIDSGVDGRGGGSKSASEPDSDALLRRRRGIPDGEGRLRLSFDRRPRLEVRIEMLDDFVRFGRTNAGFEEDDGRGGGAERGVSSGAGEAGLVG